MNTFDRNALVLENLPIVGSLVAEVCSKSRYLSRDDLTSAGSEALIHAASSFDASKGLPFHAYARIRVRGAILDEMRRSDWASRDTRRRINAARATSDSLTAALGRTPTPTEIAETLGVSTDEVEKSLADDARTVYALDDVMENLLPADSGSPEKSVVSKEESEHLHAAVNALPAQMRYIVEQVYFGDRSVKDLAEELGVSHVRISQQRSEAIRMLHDGMTVHVRPAEEAPKAKVSTARLNAYLGAVAEHTLGGITRTRTLSPAAA